MTVSDRIHLFSTLDFLALAFFVLSWLWIGWRIEHPPKSKPSVSLLMADHRREWMTQMLYRTPRVADSQIIGSLRQATAFFTSASMLALGGGIALVGNTDQLANVAKDLALERPPHVVWEIKLIATLLMLTNAFLVFVWSHRLFGYCSVLMAAVPNSPDEPGAHARARQAGEINITAARSFNRGLRSTYFALAGLTWLAGPLPMIFATMVTTGVLYRREFASTSRKILLSTVIKDT